MNKKQLQARATELGVDFVSRTSVTELGARIAAAEATKPKAPRAGKGGKAAKPNAEVAALVEAIGSGEFAKALAAAELSPGGLARQLGVEGAVVAKLTSGKRTPRPNAPADSIAGRVAAWYREAKQ